MAHNVCTGDQVRAIAFGFQWPCRLLQAIDGAFSLDRLSQKPQAILIWHIERFEFLDIVRELVAELINGIAQFLEMKIDQFKNQRRLLWRKIKFGRLS